MCSSPESLCTSLLFWWPRFWLQLSIEQASMLRKSSGSGLSSKWRTPLLTLHVNTLKPMQRLSSTEPRRERWLRTTGD